MLNEANDSIENNLKAILDKMKSDYKMSRTLTGKPEIILASGNEITTFSEHAREFVDRFSLSVKEKIEGHGEMMWIVTRGEYEFCISWDDCCDEITVMAWCETPDEEMEEFLSGGNN